MSSPISRRRSSPTCATDRPWRSRSTAFPGSRSRAMSTAWRRPAGSNLLCCRPTTPPAISPRSSSASPSRSSSTATMRWPACCVRACPSNRSSTPRRPCSLSVKARRASPIAEAGEDPAMSAVALDDRTRSVPRRLAPPAAPPPANENAAAPPVALKTWLAVIGSTLGAFLAVLNIQIVNSSLADIQGAIGAGIDDGGWISTSYLVTEIIVIPLSGWLSRVFSLRVFLLANTVLFLVFSVACAFAQNLGQMIVLRAFQGFSGGVLIPLSFTIIISLLPKAKQSVGLALFALSATFAPAIGPTIGGWLNENYGWQYIFYVNLAPGVLMLAMLWPSLQRAPMQLGLLKHGDGLGALETVLEEGNKDDWFGSSFILRLALVAAVALPLFVWRELAAAKPLLDLRLLRRRNFGFGTLANFMLGAALYGSSFILPLYLSQVQATTPSRSAKCSPGPGCR